MFSTWNGSHQHPPLPKLCPNHSPRLGRLLLALSSLLWNLCSSLEREESIFNPVFYTIARHLGNSLWRSEMWVWPCLFALHSYKKKEGRDWNFYSLVVVKTIELLNKYGDQYFPDCWTQSDSPNSTSVRESIHIPFRDKISHPPTCCHLPTSPNLLLHPNFSIDNFCFVSTDVI